MTMADISTLDQPIGGLMEGVTDALNADAVQSLASGAPEWLQNRRLDAWATYERTPMPSTRLEEWRYTDLSRLLELDSLEPLPWSKRTFDRASAPASLDAALEADREASGRVVELDGSVAHVELDADLAEKGVRLLSLRDAVEEIPEVLERRLATEALPATDGKFQALNAALWQDGIVLVVPRGVRMEDPIRVTRHVSRTGQAIFSRVLIVAEPGSQVSFVDEIVSEDLEEQTLFSSAVEIFAEDAAQVQYVSLQRMGRGAFHLAQQRTIAGKDSTLDTLNVTMGASISRLDLNARLMGPGANSDMLGLCFGDGDQHFDHNTSQDHDAPHTHSDLLYKGALDDRARSVFRGIIRVAKGSQQTDAYQTNRNLLLSEHARADSLPNLEIEADDVRCSHGATVGQLDQDHLFYLMSRGLSRPQAERLVVIGFLGEVLQRLPLGGVVEKVSRGIEEKLNG
ncbi:MAG: Fe-S cluster assembly protein SufD [Gemmatimonadales bacterium]|nr:MAG: Fe-S cluster assembly protein SufD [Gemmatimonadales bacterium]